MIEYLYQGKIRAAGAIKGFFSQDKMKSFSLDIPALQETIGYLTGCIENLQEIGVGVVQVGKNLVDESWDGKATQDFSANMDNWKKCYDICLSNMICFRDGLELEILPKAKEANELALGLALTLGGTKGVDGRNIISMEPEGIDELKGRCNTLVNDVYEEQNQIMDKIVSLESTLHYGSPVAAGIGKNKQTIQENQEKLQDYKYKLAEYEAQVQVLERLTVEKMAACCNICGQRLDVNNFKQFLTHSKDSNLTEILSKDTAALSDIEKLAVQYALQTGNTEKITECVNRRFGLEDITSEQFNSWGEDIKQQKLNEITEYIAKFIPNVSVATPDIEIPIGIDMTAYYNLATTIQNPEGSAFTINTIAKDHKLMFQSISTTTTMENASFTMGNDGHMVFTLNSTDDKTTITCGPTMSLKENEIGMECAIETQLKEGTVTSTLGIKKSVNNVRTGWETVPVEIPVIATNPWNNTEYPPNWYASYSLDDTLENVKEFCNEHPVITTIVIGGTVAAAIYFTGGAALLVLA
ncbi:hypothetical protein [Aminipila sp.]|uniref:hypothetical protein n=1 Tax=Aminipila sp. TaxID=2060095 RepID=UPI00289D8D84|nr:hypothetical protein [Aminipila sp.]